MDYAIRAISRRSHSVHELREKLKKRKEHNKENEDKIINRLGELNLLNDEDYIRRTIENSINLNPQGPRKIAQRLYRKGIPTKVTNSVWDSLNINEKEVALKALEKFNRVQKPMSPKKLYQKRTRFLASRGFSPSIVFSLNEDI
ncbi:regulatory protein RecX [Candidatus Peregrinibacteria bacterium]|nr:regulatory protein RecX [Candidatus Peregrinibacteria bacterium]